MAERVPISQWVQRWYYVVASHRPSQLGWRAFKLLQRRYFPLRGVTVSLPADEEVRVRQDSGLEPILQRHLSLRAARGTLTERARALMSGEFCFLNEARQLGPLGDAPLESVEPVSHLWRFHLHYQEYLLDLVTASQFGDIPEAQERVWPIIKAWMKTHPVDRPGALNDAWHPFCLSRRIAVWWLLWQSGVIPTEHRESFLRRLEEQTCFLERHLEWDLRGNHLFENLRTLILAGAAGEGERADRRLDAAIGLCEGQIREQILPGGEHFERSPMYHAQMLSAMLDIRDAAEPLRPAFAEVCRQTAVRMASFVGRQLHPDGQVPLLSDSAIEETPCPTILVLHAAPPEETSPVVLCGADGCCEFGDYWTWRDGDHFLLFDRGPVAADDLPAHAHNDLLTIEASLHGRRLIIDSGVFDYEDSEMRRYCRSTAAHNVLQIDGDEQCDLWSRFRMGRRGRPVGSTSGTDGRFCWTAVIHAAYARIGVPRVGRWIACRAGGPWIFADWADGTGSHRLDHWVHLAPDVEVVVRGDQTAELCCRGTRARLRFHSIGKLSLETGWSCPDFGVRLEAPVIRFQQTAELPGMIVWTLEWDESQGDISVRMNGQGEPLIIWQSNTEEISWSPQSLLELRQRSVMHQQDSNTDHVENQPARPVSRRRRCLIAVMLLFVVFHVSLLQAIGEALTPDDPEGNFDAVLILGGDHRIQAAAEFVRMGRVEQIWLIEERPDYAVSAGILPSDVEVQRGRLIELGIEQDQIEVLGAPEVDDLPDVVRLLEERFADESDLRLLAICGAFSGRHVRFVLDDVLTPTMAARVAIHGLPYDRFEVHRWWRSRSGLKQIFNEFCSLGFTLVSGTQPRDPPPATDPEAIEAQLRRRFGGAACYAH